MVLQGGRRTKRKHEAWPNGAGSRASIDFWLYCDTVGQEMLERDPKTRIVPLKRYDRFEGWGVRRFDAYGGGGERRKLVFVKCHRRLLSSSHR